MWGVGLDEFIYSFIYASIKQLGFSLCTEIVMPLLK